MAENATSVLNLAKAASVSGDDVVYLVQGEGSDRDKQATIAQIAEYIAPEYSDYSKWKTFTGSGASQTFDLGDWTGNSIIRAYPNSSRSGSTYPSSITVTQDAISGISIVVPVLYKDSCSISYKVGSGFERTATINRYEIAILSSYGAYGAPGPVASIAVLPSKYFGNFDALNVSGDATIAGTLNVPQITGTFEGESDSYLLFQSNLTVNGDLDVKGSVLGNDIISADNLASDSVTTEKIADGAVTKEKIGAQAVGTTEIADGAVTANEIKNGAVTTEKLADNLKKAIGTVNQTVTVYNTSGGLVNIGTLPLIKSLEPGNSLAVRLSANFEITKDFVFIIFPTNDNGNSLGNSIKYETESTYAYPNDRLFSIHNIPETWESATMLELRWAPDSTSAKDTTLAVSFSIQY